MAESKEFQLRKNLVEAYGKLSSDRRLNKETSGGTPSYIESAYSEIHKHVVNDISAQDAQELLNPNSEFRYAIAMQSLEKMAALRAGQSYQESQEKGHTQGDTAKATLEVLQNRDKYGLLDGKTEEDVLEVAWFTTGTIDALSPEEVQKKALEKKKAERKEYLESKVKNKKALEMQYTVDAAKIDAKGLSEKEMRDARRLATIEYLQEKLKDETWATRTSNSVGDLYASESFLIGAAKLGSDKALSAEAKEKLAKGFEELGEKSGAMGVLMRTQKGAQFFRDPSGYLASKAGGAVAKIAAKQASKWAIKAALALGLNAIAPVVGQIAAELVSRVIEPLVRNLILANGERLKKFVKTAIAAAAGFAIFLGGALGAGVVSAAAYTGAIGLILVPLVAVILFIINAGGYIVPPGPTFTGDGSIYYNEPGTGGNAKVNAYLSVEKTANPAGPFENSELPLSIEYTITITAKQQALNHIRFNYNCNAVGDAPVIYCPPISPQIPAPPDRIEAGPANAFVIKYTVNYPASFKNTIAMDTFTVTADGTVGDVTNLTETGFASVQFGTVPTGCYKLDGTWPNREKQMMIGAIGQMLTYRRFMSKLCSDGDVLLQYYPNVSVGHGLTTDGTRYWGHTFDSPLRIEFYPVGFGSASSVFFTLAHESGHAIYHTTVGRPLLQQFADTVTLPSSNNGFICTYPFKEDPTPPNVCNIGSTRCTEDFAESAVLYAIGQGSNAGYHNYSCLLQEGSKDGTFKGAYPTMWNFMNSSVF